MRQIAADVCVQLRTECVVAITSAADPVCGIMIAFEQVMEMGVICVMMMMEFVERMMVNRFDVMLMLVMMIIVIMTEMIVAYGMHFGVKSGVIAGNVVRVIGRIVADGVMMVVIMMLGWVGESFVMIIHMRTVNVMLVVMR